MLAPAPRSGGSPWAARRRRLRAVAEAIERRGEIGRPFEIVVYRNGQYWNVSDRRLRRGDGAVVEVDRNSNTWAPKSRETAYEAMRRGPINDEVVF
jgi:hypothetical protein